MSEKPVRWRWTLWVNFVALSLGIVGAVASVTQFLDPRDERQRLEGFTFGPDTSIGGPIADTGSLEERMAALEASLSFIRPDTPTIIASERPSRRPTLRSLSTDIRALAVAQARLERVIVEDPQRALAMPLLRRDLDSVRAANRLELDALKDSIDRLYTFLIGLFAGVIGLAATNLVAQRRKGEAASN